MQAIQTKLLLATNARGYRIKATAAAGSVTIPQPADLEGEAAHLVAAQALAKKFGWDRLGLGDLHGGSLANGDMVFLFRKG
jgi:hypothetical protein